MLSSPAAPRPPRQSRAASRTAQLSMEGAYDVAARVASIEATGRRIANLSIGEPSFATPEHVVEAGVRALRQGATRYTPVAGIPPLRDAIATSLIERGIASATTDNILVTPGAKPALFYALLALIEPGDEVLLPDPGFPAYESIVRFAGGIPVGYSTSPQSAGDPAELESRITSNTRVLIVNAPGNPNGALLSPSALIAIAEIAERHDLTIVSDECYGKLLFDGSEGAPSIASVDRMAERTVVVDSFSKTYAMTGWRLGYLLAPQRLTRTLQRLAVNGHSCTPDFVQRAGIAALTGSQGPLQRMRAELHGRRDVLVNALNDIDGIRCVAPAGAFYAFADISRIAARRGISSDAFANWLLDDVRVAGVPGTAFGARGDGFIRFSFAAPTDAIALGIDRLRHAFGRGDTP